MSSPEIASCSSPIIARKSLPWFLVIFLITSFPLLGLLCSLGLVFAYNAAWFSSWRTLYGPPGQTVEIVRADLDTVTVRTGDGKFFSCQHPVPQGANCWRESGEPSPLDPETVYDQPLYKGEVEPPGAVLDTLAATRWYADEAFEARYALLDDGEVFVWEYSAGGLIKLLLLGCGPFAGCMLGVLLLFLLSGTAGLIRLAHRPGA